MKKNSKITAYVAFGLSILFVLALFYPQTTEKEDKTKESITKLINYIHDFCGGETDNPLLPSDEDTIMVFEATPNGLSVLFTNEKGNDSRLPLFGFNSIMLNEKEVSVLRVERREGGSFFVEDDTENYLVSPKIFLIGDKCKYQIQLDNCASFKIDPVNSFLKK